MTSPLNNTVGASTLTPLPSTHAAARPTSSLAPRVANVEQEQPEEARAQEVRKEALLEAAGKLLESIDTADRADRKQHEVRKQELLTAAEKLLNPDREIWDAPAAALDVIAQYAEFEQLQALHDVSPALASTMNANPAMNAALETHKSLAGLKADEAEMAELLRKMNAGQGSPAELSRLKNLMDKTALGRDAITVADRRRTGVIDTTLEEELGARSALEMAARTIFSELRSLADAPDIHQAAANAQRVLDAIQPHLKTLASRPIPMNGFGEFVDIGRNQVGDSKPQLQALRAGIDRLMLAPGYDQLKVFCGPVNAWVGYLLRDRF